MALHRAERRRAQGKPGRGALVKRPRTARWNPEKKKDPSIRESAGRDEHNPQGGRKPLRGIVSRGALVELMPKIPLRVILQERESWGGIHFHQDYAPAGESRLAWGESEQSKLTIGRVIRRGSGFR